MNTELQRAQDMLAVMQAQRDNALNANVLAQAEIAGLRRQLAGLDSALKEAHQERDKAVLDLKDAQDNIAKATDIAAPPLADVH